jgi:capsular exopolysaccharide synthesis family protein
MLRESDLRAERRQLAKIPEETMMARISEEVVQVQAGPGADVLVQNDPRGVLADRLRFLRAHLRSLWSEEKLKSLLIASPSPHDGKSTVALNLGVVLAEGGKRRVLVIEADMHHPTITERLQLGYRTTAGLAECLHGSVDPHDAILKIDPLEVFLLAAGNNVGHPTELLQSDALEVLMRALRREFDWVIVDSPPVQPLPDALLLRQKTDATLLVIRSGATSKTAAEGAVALLGKKHILGMVVNGVGGLEQAYSKYYGSYGGNGNGNG